MLDKLIRITGLQNDKERQAKLYKALLKHEAKIGGKLFGPVPKGGRREFFCLDEYTWVWYEEWVGKDKKRRSKTTRYDVRPGGITKIQDGKKYMQLSDSETVRLLEAIRSYEKRTKAELYEAVL